MSANGYLETLVNGEAMRGVLHIAVGSYGLVVLLTVVVVLSATEEERREAAFRVLSLLLPWGFLRRR
ncbi:hypothetical protein FNQ90_06395 [Streptomyces alkaliphilus]|uniref:Uncharacterized protein n=1 Tax=Streptomyces alkaliphilus TaxID=1472722 RepID=A0A7W3Y0S0_9ACTN|nr:hypothetical protein [Streptomyces alkaliphilus]MBB0243748.1 hypothetical protein [Streptomyces alkaliphilus]